jgi:hypothetical protein
MRAPRSKALVFFVRFAVLFALVMVPWPGLATAFNQTFSVIASMAVDACVEDPSVIARFHPANPELPDDASLGPWDTVFTVSSTRNEPALRVPLPLRRVAYVPLATFLALAVATPLGRPQKLRILGWGLALLVLRLALTVALPIARHFQVFGQETIADWLARVVYYGLLEPPNLMYGAPVVVWFLLLFASSPETISLAIRSGPSPTPTTGPDLGRPLA